jgi:hypothetical protein
MTYYVKANILQEYPNPIDGTSIGKVHVLDIGKTQDYDFAKFMVSTVNGFIEFKDE